MSLISKVVKLSIQTMESVFQLKGNVIIHGLLLFLKKNSDSPESAFWQGLKHLDLQSAETRRANVRGGWVRGPHDNHSVGHVLPRV